MENGRKLKRENLLYFSHCTDFVVHFFVSSRWQSHSSFISKIVQYIFATRMFWKGVVFSSELKSRLYFGCQFSCEWPLPFSHNGSVYCLCNWFQSIFGFSCWVSFLLHIVLPSLMMLRESIHPHDDCLPLTKRKSFRPHVC